MFTIILSEIGCGFSEILFSFGHKSDCLSVGDSVVFPLSQHSVTPAAPTLAPSRYSVAETWRHPGAEEVEEEEGEERGEEEKVGEQAREEGEDETGAEDQEALSDQRVSGERCWWSWLPHVDSLEGIWAPGVVCVCYLLDFASRTWYFWQPRASFPRLTLKFVVDATIIRVALQRSCNSRTSYVFYVSSGLFVLPRL